MWHGYGQFCPIAQAAEVLCERWTPLVLRDVMYGSRRFNELARGVPLMSRGLLAQRLKELQRAGVLERRGLEYRLTPAGEALRPIIEQMGLWALHWGARELAEVHLDDALLVWSLRRAFRPSQPPGVRTVLRLDFYGLPPKARTARRSWWLVAEGEEVDVCLKDPGFDEDAIIAADLRTFMEVLLGRRGLRAALREGTMKIAGAPQAVRRVPQWLPLNGELLRGMGIAPGTPVPGGAGKGGLSLV